ncbi:MAG: ATP-binding protein [Deltaproteobacteria bacterium]|nr:ATP-binding protein [Deltaproteobacteria bacterium]
MAGRDIKKLNVDMGCDFKCEDCEKYFDCNAPQKETFKKRGVYARARDSMAKIKHKILILGGKGGVGKSMGATNIAYALAMRGRKVTILDQNFDCPTIPIMLGMEGGGMRTKDEGGLIPAVGPKGIQVMSMGLILGEDEVLTWFHDLKRNATEEFLGYTDYGERDYLIVDIPAGTSSETVNVIKLIPEMSGSVVFTVPSEVSQNVAKKAVLISQKANVPVIGIIENMSELKCPKCGKIINVMQSGGGESLSGEMNVPLIGKIPMSRDVAVSLDAGEPFVEKYPDNEATVVINRAVDMIEEACGYK